MFVSPVRETMQPTEHDRVDLTALLAYLGKEKAIDSVIVEGGATLLWSFFSKVWSTVCKLISPQRSSAA